jgi:UDP-N-acetylglucosamine--N-acetylmuramyl-(pentapeptide) pyrophosphoryl-undecaprenol N-acetylglucosamine transferase
VPFIHDMTGAYACAGLALCRAGATTLAELAATGTPAVLVPFPFAAHDHQTANARALADAGGAVLVPEGELKNRNMGALLLDLLERPEKLRAMSAAARTMARPDAADLVAGEIIRLAAPRTADSPA